MRSLEQNKVDKQIKGSKLFTTALQHGWQRHVMYKLKAKSKMKHNAKTTLVLNLLQSICPVVWYVTGNVGQLTCDQNVSLHLYEHGRLLCVYLDGYVFENRDIDRQKPSGREKFNLQKWIQKLKNPLQSPVAVFITTENN